jgi:hypothetical protein
MRLEYITGPVRVWPFNPISASVLNHGAMKELVRIRIYQRDATGALSLLIVDTGDIEVIATGTYGAGIPAPVETDFWVQINTSSESLIPTATFGSVAAGLTNSVIFCSPGDFAVFESGRRRI